MVNGQNLDWWWILDVIHGMAFFVSEWRINGQVWLNIMLQGKGQPSCDEVIIFNVIIAVTVDVPIFNCRHWFFARGSCFGSPWFPIITKYVTVCAHGTHTALDGQNHHHHDQVHFYRRWVGAKKTQQIYLHFGFWFLQWVSKGRYEINGVCKLQIM